MPKQTQSFYAVRQGRRPGVYRSWAACKAQVEGFPNAIYKKFPTHEEAEAFTKEKSGLKRATTSHQRSNIPPTVSSSSSSPQQRVTTTTTKKTPPSVLDDSPTDGRHIVYTDGASSGNGYHGAKAGYGVFWGDNDPRNQGGPLPGDRQTNQRAELYAMIRAMEQDIKGENILEIRTDSQYSINCVETWSKSWIKNGWKSSKGTPVENADLVKKLLALRKSRPGKIEFSYVPGHRGVYGNEMADQLAVQGAKSIA